MESVRAGGSKPVALSELAYRSICSSRLLQQNRRKAAVAYANGLNQARGGGAWPLTVGSRDINASVACANIGAFVAAAFIPAEKAAVASVTIVT